MKKALSIIMPLVAAFLITVILMSVLYISINRPSKYSNSKMLPAHMLKQVEEKYRLNTSNGKLYFQFLGKVLFFDYGPSFIYKSTNVNDLLKLKIAPTLLFLLLFIALSIVCHNIKTTKIHIKHKNLISIFISVSVFTALVFFKLPVLANIILVIVQICTCLLYIFLNNNNRIIKTAICFFAALLFLDIELVLNIKGITSYSISAAMNRDYFLVFAIRHVQIVLASISALIIYYIDLIPKLIKNSHK